MVGQKSTHIQKWKVPNSRGIVMTNCGTNSPPRVVPHSLAHSLTHRSLTPSRSLSPPHKENKESGQLSRRLEFFHKVSADSKNPTKSQFDTPLINIKVVGIARWFPAKRMFEADAVNCTSSPSTKPTNPQSSSSNWSGWEARLLVDTTDKALQWERG